MSILNMKVWRGWAVQIHTEIIWHTLELFLTCLCLCRCLCIFLCYCVAWLSGEHIQFRSCVRSALVFVFVFVSVFVFFFVFVFVFVFFFAILLLGCEVSIFNSGVVSKVSWSAGVKADLTRDREASVSWAGYIKSTKHSTGYIKLEHNSVKQWTKDKDKDKYKDKDWIYQTWTQLSGGGNNEQRDNEKDKF